MQKLIVIFFSILMALSVMAADSNNRSLDHLLESEKRTIHIYHSVVPSVVNVSNIRVGDSFFYGKV